MTTGNKKKTEDSFICEYDNPIVETTSGKLRGFIWNGVYTFLGVRYAAAKRFQLPEEVKWEGIRNAWAYGAVCPSFDPQAYENEIMTPHRCWKVSEDCQFLNIWTPDIKKTSRKPVMVWLHGGGFSGGSSIEQISYDGENLSQYGDVVVVTLNHRLNILGYLDLSFLGEKYKNSVNAGSEDIVAALKWIRKNIEDFGGDPENITLFGQSGGGMKVWTLMQNPCAEGLFQKAIVQSGVLDNISIGIEEDSSVLGRALLDELGITPAQADKLEEISYQQLSDAYNKVLPDIQKIKGYMGNEPKPGANYLGDPRETGFCSWAKKIPMIIGSVFGEFNSEQKLQEFQGLTECLVREKIEETYGAKAEKLIRLFKQTYPDRKLQDLLVLDSMFRMPVITFIKERMKSGIGNTYSYLFTYDFPFFGEIPAWHCSEIPFIFHNINKIPVCNADSAEAQKLQKNMSDAWINFARYGNPEFDGPEWIPCGKDEEFTMIFDKKCELKKNFDHELMKILA